LHAKRSLLWLYLLFLLVILAQSTWWLIFIERQGGNKTRLQLQHLELDLAHARSLVDNSPAIFATEGEHLDEQFPDLIFHSAEGRHSVSINPAATAKILEENRRRRNMFLWEGGFFLTLLLCGAGMVFLAHRREKSYLRARELFLAGVTHEFKTPLASLSLYRETLIRPDLDSEKRQSILSRMGRDLERLQQMVEQILVVSRTGHTGNLEMEPLNVREIVDEVLDDLGQLIEQKGARITCDLDQVPPVHADHHALATALRNLMTNALAHSPAPAEIGIKLTSHRARIRLTVSDNGSGIPRRERKKIFESFYRVGESDGRPPGTHGSGLGLHLTKRYLDEMGVRIELRSEVGKGSDFTMILKAYQTGKREELT
jgi:two-component system, OmpR family, phosphate regulon sensor histidine kinase PhoR